MNSLVSLLISLLFSLRFTIAITEDFRPHDEISGVATPDHILPKKQSGECESLKNFSQDFKFGKLKCSTLLQRPTGLTSIQRNFLSQYGVLFIQFGPQTCSTFSRCWFGMLSCGEMKHQSFLQEYHEDLKKNRSTGGGGEYSPPLPSREIPHFLRWSMQSLNFQFRVVGPEILFPEVIYDPLENLLLCFYTLTIPGSYQIQIVPREFYPGVLFNYTEQEKIEGYHLLVYKSLLFTVKPEIIFHPLTTSHDTISTSGNKSLPFFPSTLPPLLPFCSNGNHQGRYLTIPRESLKICGTDKLFVRRVVLERDSSKHDVLMTTLERNYIASNHTDHNLQLRKFLIQQYHSQSLPIGQRLLAQELLKHTDETSSLCALIVVNKYHHSPGLRDTSHEIFAPYRCRYKYYSPLQVFLFPSPPLLLLFFPPSFSPSFSSFPPPSPPPSLPSLPSPPLLLSLPHLP
jgi:hypothetical protein